MAGCGPHGQLGSLQATSAPTSAGCGGLGTPEALDSSATATQLHAAVVMCIVVMCKTENFPSHDLFCGYAGGRAGEREAARQRSERCRGRAGRARRRGGGVRRR